MCTGLINRNVPVNFQKVWTAVIFKDVMTVILIKERSFPLVSDDLLRFSIVRERDANRLF